MTEEDATRAIPEPLGAIQRDRARVQATAEVFTPPWLVDEMLGKLFEADPTLFSDPAKTFLEPSCGEGAFLVAVLRWKAERCSVQPPPVGDILRACYGIDIMPDNVEVCRAHMVREAARLAGVSDVAAWADWGDVVRSNIVCHDALEWDYENWLPAPHRLSFEVVEAVPDLFGGGKSGVEVRVVAVPLQGRPAIAAAAPVADERQVALDDLFGPPG